MYEAHRKFPSPSDDALLWRYMDLSKLIDILHRKSLFFPRADRLGDPWEGGTSYFNAEGRAERYSKLGIDPSQSVRMKTLREATRKHTYVSCWHENPNESAAMWKLYLKSNEGIAVRTNFSRLKSCFRNSEKQIFIGKINYFDPNSDVLPEGNTLSQFLFKLNHYKHEMEVRAVFQDFPTKLGFEYDEPAAEYGLHIPIELETLIENIYLAPGTPAWLVEAVQAVVIQFGLPCPILPSDLDRPPVF